MEGSSLTPEFIIEGAPVFLKAYYEEQQGRFQKRLENFELVNWPQLKQTLKYQLDAQGEGQSAESMMRQVIRWIEATLTD